MPIDSYSPCPGGLDKKVKFCCHDLVSELDKIQRMIEGEQRTACLDHIEKLEGKYPGRACLLVTKLLLQEQLEKLDDAGKTVEQLLTSHPENPIALAVSAVQSAEEEGALTGIEPLQRAMLHCPQQMPYELFDAVGQVGRMLAAESHLLAAVGHLRHYALLASGDRNALSMLYQLNSSPRVPLIFKDWMYFGHAPEGALWQPDFDLAVQFAQMGAWRQAEQRLTVLANRVQDSPEIWKNLAVWRGWLADYPRAVEALRAYAALEIPLDDAVEAEAIAQLIHPDGTYDKVDLLAIERPILDVEKLKERFAAAPNVVSLPIDPRRMAADEEQPPPQALFVLNDKPALKSGDPISVATLPVELCQVFVFGRETDREPRLEVLVYRDEKLASTRAKLNEIAGDAIGGDEKEEVFGSASTLMRLLRPSSMPPADASPDAIRALVQEHVSEYLPRGWLKLPMPLFDGQSPSQVAGKPEYRIKLLGALLALEMVTETAALDTERIRNELGLPTAPVPLDGADVSHVPLVRLHRLPIEELSDQQLVVVFRRAQANAATRALRRAASAIVARESAPADAKITAHAALSSLTTDITEAIGHLRGASELAVAAGKSSAEWDIAELELQMAHGNGPEMQRLLNHIQTEHLREPGVRERLMQIFIAAGVITPDGRMRVPESQAAAASSLVLPSGESAAEPGKLWTPGSDQPAAKSALWTPGMD